MYILFYIWELHDDVHTLLAETYGIVRKMNSVVQKV